MSCTTPAGSTSTTGDDPDEFFLWLEEAIADINAQGCDVTLYQAGADMHIDDPLGGLLDDAQMRQRDRTVFRKVRAGWSGTWPAATGVAQTSSATPRCRRTGLPWERPMPPTRRGANCLSCVTAGGDDPDNRRDQCRGRVGPTRACVLVGHSANGAGIGHQKPVVVCAMGASSRSAQPIRK